jgi:ATP-dependent RNA helicase DeaD
MSDPKSDHQTPVAADNQPATPTFAELDLKPGLLQALNDVGYEAPSPIQQQAIPILLAGADLLGHAPTGTGKTAAFALPLISRVDLNNRQVQILTLAPTRELALQVAEAFQTYAKHLPGFKVLPIYGGQDYKPQLQRLRSGVHVVVGTPGRIMDHLRRGTLKLDGLQAVVLDEADEMLRMGFVEEVQWILDQTPKSRQMALFSATMPKVIRQIAHKHMRDPQEISIKAKTATADTIRQRYWPVRGMHKLDALTRMLEVEETDGVLIFVRTKSSTTELANRLEARGYAVSAMNGDMPQSQREQTVSRLKRGSLDILVATDVAARGLDVDRISHVINYDIPHDVESYIHRIGRTGRAGRKGEALLFVAPRERRMLGDIERATRQKLEQFELPTTEVVNSKRIADFKQKITDTLATGELAFMQNILEQYQQEHDVQALDIAAALAQLVVGDTPLLLEKEARRERFESDDRGRDRNSRSEPRPRRLRSESTEEFDKYRLEVGSVHGVKTGNIVGAIANEVGIAARSIGRVEVLDDCSFVDLPKGMPAEIFQDLKKVWVCGQMLNLSLAEGGSPNVSADAGSGGNRPVRRRDNSSTGPRSDRSDRAHKSSDKPFDKDSKKNKSSKKNKKSSNADDKSGSGKKSGKKFDKKSEKKFGKKKGKSSQGGDKAGGKKFGSNDSGGMKPGPNKGSTTGSNSSSN